MHLTAAHRVLRAQDFGGAASAHFRLFVLVSSARDTGSGVTQARLLNRHLTYRQTVLTELAPAVAPQPHVTTFDDDVVRERLADTVRPALDGGVVPLEDEPERRRGRGHYTGCALRITVLDGSLEIGDGGLTDWTARLSGDAKEHCLATNASSTTWPAEPTGRCPDGSAGGRAPWLGWNGGGQHGREVRRGRLPGKLVGPAAGCR